MPVNDSCAVADIIVRDRDRDLVPWVWCACWKRCGGIGVPGFIVRGTLELCVACAAADRTERVTT